MHDSYLTMHAANTILFTYALFQLFKRGLFTSKHPESDFSQKCCFPKDLDNVELNSNMKIQKIILTGSTNMEINLPRCP